TGNPPITVSNGTGATDTKSNLFTINQAPPVVVALAREYIYLGDRVIAVEGPPPAPDSTPPSAPSSLAYSNLTPSSVVLNWSGSTDTGGSGMAGYHVQRQLGSGAFQ